MTRNRKTNQVKYFKDELLKESLHEGVDSVAVEALGQMLKEKLGPKFFQEFYSSALTAIELPVLWETLVTLARHTNQQDVLQQVQQYMQQQGGGQK